MSQPPGYPGSSPQGSPEGQPPPWDPRVHQPQSEQWRQQPQSDQWGQPAQEQWGQQTRMDPVERTWTDQWSGSASGPGPAQNYPTPVPPGAPPAAPAPRGKRRRTGLIVTLCILGLVLIIGGAFAVRAYQAKTAEERAVAAARKAEEERRLDLTRQQAAATTSTQSYLEALAASDAEKALTLAAAPPEGNNSLLTREVLTESNSRAALTGATVDETVLTEDSPGVWTKGTAKVRYSLGEQPQTAELPLRKVGQEWKIDQVAAPVKLGLSGPERQVNGTKVSPGDYNLFPGSYSVTSTNPLVGLSATEFVLKSPVDTETNWEPEPILTDEGKKQSVEASKRALDECLKAKELSPAQCPFIRWKEDDVVIDKNTIKYTLRNDPWQNVAFRFNGSTMTATATVTVTHRIEANATKDGRRGQLQPQDQTLPAFVTVKLGENPPKATFT